VVVWTLLGYGDAEGIFPSVPAMGSAFAAHFIMSRVRDGSPDNPFGRFPMPTQQTFTYGVAALVLVFAVVESSYAVLGPEASDGSSGNDTYQLSYTVSEWTETQTLNLNDGETQTFEVTLDESMTAVLSAQLTITYSDTGEALTAACDDVVTAPDYSGLAGPLAESDDQERSTNACGSTTVVGTIVPDAALQEYASGAGDYTLNGTEADLIDVLTAMGQSPEMMGTLSMDVTLNVNNGNPFGGDSTETVTVTLSMLTFQPSGMDPVRA